MSEPPAHQATEVIPLSPGDELAAGTGMPAICRLSAVSSGDLALLDRECNRPPWTAKLFEQEFRHDYSRILGARLGGRLVAFLVYHLLFDEAHIVNFGVSRENRGRGIGRGLLTTALDEMRDSGCRCVTLEARKSNEAAIGLYSSLGFEEIALRREYYSDDREDGIMLKLDLLEFARRLQNQRPAASV